MGAPEGYIEVSKEDWYTYLTSGGVGKQSGNLANKYSITDGQMYRHTSPKRKEAMSKLSVSTMTRFYIISSGLYKIYE